MISRAQLGILLAGPAVATLLGGATRSQPVFALVIGAWAMTLTGACLKRSPLPYSRPAKTAVAGMLGLAAMTTASMAWASVKAPALVATILAVLYAGSLLAVLPAFAKRSAARLAEPAVWITAVVAAGYGLSERVFPRQITLERSIISLGRLSEPFGYWNALGLFTGIGLILAVSTASDPERTPLLRRCAAASMPLLGAALWMTFSRGALAATAAGLFALLAIRRSRASAAAGLMAAASIGAMAIVVEDNPYVKQVGGSLTNRLRDAQPFGVELVIAIVIAGAAWTAVRAADRSRKNVSPGLARLFTLAAVLLAIAPFASAATGQRQSVAPESGASAARLTSPESDRSAYWRIQLDQFAESPLYGVGGGSFLAAWTQHRGSREPARNAHSLPIEILGDLGLIGLLLFLMLAGGIAVSARRAVVTDQRLAAGPAAALLAFAAHSMIDWDWQVPGLMLAVILLAGVPLAVPPQPSGDGPPRTFLLRRATIATVSIAVMSWFGLLSHELSTENRAISTIDAAQILGWNSERYSRVQSQLADAQKLNPDPRPAIWGFIVAQRTGNAADSERLAREVLASNRGSWFAWQMLAYATRTTHPSESAQAAKRAAELRPARHQANR